MPENDSVRDKLDHLVSSASDLLSSPITKDITLPIDEYHLANPIRVAPSGSLTILGGTVIHRGLKSGIIAEGPIFIKGEEENEVLFPSKNNKTGAPGILISGEAAKSSELKHLIIGGGNDPILHRYRIKGLNGFIGDSAINVVDSKAKLEDVQIEDWRGVSSISFLRSKGEMTRVQVLRGGDISNAPKYNGAGISIHQSTVNIENGLIRLVEGQGLIAVESAVFIENIDVTECLGAGIVYSRSSGAILGGNSRQNGIGIFVYEGFDFNIKNFVIKRNKKSGVVLVCPQEVVLTECPIRSNGRAKYGGGVYLDLGKEGTSRAEILGCEIIGNSAKCGGGVVIKGIGNGTYSFEGTIIDRNTVTEKVGGVLFEASKIGNLEELFNGTMGEENIPTKFGVEVGITGGFDYGPYK